MYTLLKTVQEIAPMSPIRRMKWEEKGILRETEAHREAGAHGAHTPDRVTLRAIVNRSCRGSGELGKSESVGCVGRFDNVRWSEPLVFVAGAAGYGVWWGIWQFSGRSRRVVGGVDGARRLRECGGEGVLWERWPLWLLCLALISECRHTTAATHAGAFWRSGLATPVTKYRSNRMAELVVGKAVQPSTVPGRS